MFRRRLETGLLEQSPDRNARPAGISDGSETPLNAGDGWRKEPTAVSSALQDTGRGGPRHRFQVGQRQREGGIDFTIDDESPCLWIDGRRIPMAADEEQVVRRQVVGQELEGSFRIDGVAVPLQEPSPGSETAAARGGDECRGSCQPTQSAVPRLLRSTLPMRSGSNSLAPCAGDVGPPDRGKSSAPNAPAVNDDNGREMSSSGTELRTRRSRSSISRSVYVPPRKRITPGELSLASASSRG